MKIGKALSEKKAAQNALSRLMTLREKTMFHEEDKEPELVFSELEDLIDQKIRMIKDLKLRIIYTNCNHRLENEMMLQEAIINIGDLRSELKAYNSLLDKEPGGRSYFGSSRDTDKEYLSQISKREIMDKIEKLESEKNELDSLIARANNTVDIVDEVPG